MVNSKTYMIISININLCQGWVWVKGIVSQTDKRWSSVEMVGSESRYDKYFFKYANIYLHIWKNIFISQKMWGWGLAYINIFMQYILHLHKRKNIGGVCWGGLNLLRYCSVRVWFIFMSCFMTTMTIYPSVNLMVNDH